MGGDRVDPANHDNLVTDEILLKFMMLLIRVSFSVYYISILVD